MIYEMAGAFADPDKIKTLKDILADPLTDPDTSKEAQRRLLEMTKGNIFGDRADSMMPMQMPGQMSDMAIAFSNPDVQEYAQAMYNVKQKAGPQGNF